MADGRHLQSDAPDIHRGEDIIQCAGRDPGMDAETVAVVTINWNGWRHTRECLAALRASRGARWHLYLVDNGSTDDSLAHLGGLGDDVTLIEAGANLGWTGGNNLGVRHALARGHERIFLLNNDAFVLPDTLERLLAAAREAEGMAGEGAAAPPVLGPVHKGVGGPDYDFSVAAFDPRTGVPAWRTDAGAEGAPARPLIETAYVSGAAILTHRRHFEAVGPFDDRFYLNFDDTDWCVRAARAGFALLMVPDAAIGHVGSASIGGRESPLQTYFLTRNRLLFAEKHCTTVQRLRLLRRCIWQARALGDDGAPGHWSVRLWRARDGRMAAFRRALLDYALRRFGDCPPEVRRWHAAAREQQEGA